MPRPGGQDRKISGHRSARLAILREEAAAALSPDGSGGIASVTAAGTLDDDLAVPDAAELWGIPAEESRRRPDERHSPAA